MASSRQAGAKRAALLLAAVVAFVACNAIVGVQDVPPAPEIDGSASGASASSGSGSSSGVWTDSGWPDAMGSSASSGGFSSASGTSPSGSGSSSSGGSTNDASSECTAGDAGVDGGPVAIVSGLAGPDHLTIDSTYVYWTNNDGVWRIPKTGGCVQSLASSQSAWGIAVDPSNVYWTTQEWGTVMSVPIAGGPPSTLWSAPAPGVYTDGIAFDSANVYWSATWANNEGMILQEPKGGGAVSVLASGLVNPFDVTVDATRVYWTEQGPNNPQTTNGMILAARISGATPLTDGGDASGGGPVSVLADQQYAPMWIVVDSTNVYWTTASDQQPGHGTVMQASIAGPDAGMPITLANDHLPYALAVDTGFVYWGTLTDPGTVNKVPVGGGMPITLATGQHTPQSLAVDGTNVYWTNTGTQAANYLDGAIMKVAK